MDGLDPEIKWPMCAFILFVIITVFTVVVVLTGQ